MQKKLSNGKKINLWREIRFNNLKDEEFCLTTGKAHRKHRLNLYMGSRQVKEGVEMIDYEKLLDALKTIQDECAKYKFCTDCPFFVHSDDNNCGILSRNPVNWKLNKVHVIRLINQ